ncbi:adenosylcobinamide-phosphate synthase CbiB [Emcibacter nanhaiensis]|uniref:Cobalamin biosynthesis protein CobD n=1 Tax=Emcibacter nanhaiensis TaxID=1505037 RepID=A0A501PLJ6_9PROT|nr:adenosylcobinamide-phosphate synthase CbiB [Emcibacter nanhaiensis]TPD60636.1 cobalamin biosynthesis protein CobD [Emcibacter nanhaiensis]
MIPAQALFFILALDALTGDPEWLYRRIPHPAVLMGRSLAALEREFNRWETAGKRENFIRGLFSLTVYLMFWILLAVAVEIVAFTLLPVWGGWIVTVVLASTLLAARSLYDHVLAVADSPDTESGRQTVARIVGRDVAQLDEAGVNRAAVESLAENFSDGVMAPAFWFLVAGLPGLVGYKAINTADSMIGHRSPRYETFGKAAARLDDLANFLPARLTAVLFIVAGRLTRRFGLLEVFVKTMEQAAGHLSLNAGWPEAALGNILSFRLGGPRRYGEEEVDGAYMGTGRYDLIRQDIKEALKLTKVAFGVMAGVVLSVGVLL